MAALSAAGGFAVWWRALGEAPAPLTRQQRTIVILAAVAGALSRLLAIARTPWDWDEMLFMLAMRHYDVAAHRPHPPGFPLFIAAANEVHLLGLSEFRSLQLLSIVGAMLIVPATFFLCRELRLPFVTSIAATMLLAFSPNVWFFGGTAFSDVPSMTLVIVAIALLLRGCRDRRAYFAGAIVLGVAAGVRPQNLLIGCAPALIASSFRRWREVVVATLIGAAIVGASYGAAAAITGWPEYREALAAHQRYITAVDSFRSPTRPPLWKMFDWFFVRPYRALPINLALLLFITVSFVATLVKRRAPLLLAMAAFGPFCVFAWLILDRFSTSRFSIGYLPLLAILAADGIHLVARRSAIESAIATLLVAMMIVWTWPALAIVRTTASPPIEAAAWLRAHADRTTPIYVHGSMAPFAAELLDGYTLLDVMAPPVEWRSRPAGYYLREETGRVAGAVNFTRERGNLWSLARQRYFDVSVAPVAHVTFGAGWFAEERGEHDRWRWMGPRSELTLPPRAGRAKLSLSLTVPAVPATVDVRLNGATIAHVVATAPSVNLVEDVDATPRANALEIVCDRSFVPQNGDSRTLSVRLNDLQWNAAVSAAGTRASRPRGGGGTPPIQPAGTPALQVELDRLRTPGLHALPLFHRR